MRKLEKKKENLLRENEKLKNDSRCSRKTINLNNSLTNSGFKMSAMQRREVTPSPTAKLEREFMSTGSKMNGIKPFEAFK